MGSRATQPHPGLAWSSPWTWCVLLALAIVHVGAAVATGWSPWNLAIETLIYLVPGVGAALVEGVLPPLARPVRLLLVSLVLVVAWSLPMLAAGVSPWLLLLFPVWYSIALGRGGRRWNLVQVLGAGLLVAAVWRPVHVGLLDSVQAFTTSGTLGAIPAVELYGAILRDAVRLIVVPLAGLALFFGPRAAPRSAVFGAAERVRHSALVAAAAFAAAYIGAIVLETVLARLVPAGVGTNDAALYTATPLALVVLLPLLAGVGEELVFRGVLQPFLVRRFVHLRLPAATACAIAAQAILFGVAHATYGNPRQVLVPMFLALIFGVAARQGGLAAAMYVHFMLDVVVFASDAGLRYPWVATLAYGLTFLHILAGLLVGADLARRRFAAPRTGAMP